MDHPVRDAFCPIYFGSNGGRFTVGTNLPIMEAGVRSLCNKPWDCGACSLMREWLEYRQEQGWSIGWECVDCLKKTYREDERNGERKLPGFYQSGRNSSRGPDDADYDKDEPGLEGCTRCGHETSFLQLVLRTGG